MKPINAFAIVVTLCVILDTVIIGELFQRIQRLERATYPQVEIPTYGYQKQPEVVKL